VGRANAKSDSGIGRVPKGAKVSDFCRHSEVSFVWEFSGMGFQSGLFPS
jgi:hypothetical protein